jgi:hypothetical protein
MKKRYIRLTNIVILFVQAIVTALQLAEGLSRSQAELVYETTGLKDESDNIKQ